MKLSPNVLYPVHRAVQNEGKMAFVEIREKDMVANSKSLSVMKFFFDEMPEGVVEGAKIAFTGVKANFSVSMNKRKFEPEEGKVFWIDDLYVNGAQITVVGG